MTAQRFKKSHLKERCLLMPCVLVGEFPFDISQNPNAGKHQNNRQVDVHS